MYLKKKKSTRNKIEKTRGRETHVHAIDVPSPLSFTIYRAYSA